MAKAIVHSQRLGRHMAELTRRGIVAGCVLALICAGGPLSF